MSLRVCIWSEISPSSALPCKSRRVFPTTKATLPASRRLRGAASRAARLSSFRCYCQFVRDAGAAALVLGGAYSLVHAFDALTERNVIDQKLSRKTIHILSGMLFMSSWPLFSSSSEARYFAAVVPLLNCFRLVIHGLSLVNNKELVQSVTRDGKPEELLRGPLYYVLALLVCVLVFWRDSPVGVIALAMMSGGDGSADIVGRKFGMVKLPYNYKKSWAGSFAMFLSGFSVSLLMLYYFSSLGFVNLDWRFVVEKVALVSLVATVVESLPITEAIDDNIAVPLTSILTAMIIFGPL